MNGNLSNPNLRSEGTETSFVLVHGSWHGGWCWRDVAKLLRSNGHNAYCPSLTNCGENFRDQRPVGTLDQYVEDIRQLLFFEDLNDVVLVGHSYAGLILQSVANHEADRIAGLLYLDAYICEPGECGFDLWGDERGSAGRAALAAGERDREPLPPEALGVTDPKKADWVRERYTPFPLAAFEGVVKEESLDARSIPRLYIQCTEGDVSSFFAPMAAKARKWGWPVNSRQWPHAAPVTHPYEVANTCMDFSNTLNRKCR